MSSNQKAMRQFFDVLSPKINFVCRRYFREEADINDAIQESFIRIFNNLHKYDSLKGDIFGWAYRVSVNECLRILRKNSKFEFDELDESKVENINLEVSNDYESKEAMQLLDHLEGSQRIIFNLFFVEGYSHKEIGEMLDMKEVTCRSIYHRAKSKLKNAYEKIYSL